METPGDEPEYGFGPHSPEQEDLEQLAHLGSIWGYLDVDMQERTLKLYLEQLDLTIDYLRQNQRGEKCRLYTKPGNHGQDVSCDCNVLRQVRDICFTMVM